MYVSDSSHKMGHENVRRNRRGMLNKYLVSLPFSLLIELVSRNREIERSHPSMNTKR